MPKRSYSFKTNAGGAKVAGSGSLAGITIKKVTMTIGEKTPKMVEEEITPKMEEDHQGNLPKLLIKLEVKIEGKEEGTGTRIDVKDHYHTQIPKKG